MSWPVVGIIAAAVGLAAAVLLGAWWLWWRLPKRQVDRLRLTIRDPKARADVEDNFRKTIGQLLGGAAVLVGAGLAYLQFSQQQRASQEQFSQQQRASQEQFSQQQRASQEQFLQQQQTSRDLLISNQVAKGFELFGSDKAVVRLGGIYALEGVMNNSEQYHQPVLEALCPFVRDGTRTETGDGPPTTDIQAALTVIGRRKAKAIGTDQPNFAYAHIPKADLRGAYLRGANLSSADLSGANLIGADLNPDGGLFVADLRGANLIGADLSAAALFVADLRGANLSRAILSRANLYGANLTDANLIGANLIGATLTGANLRGATLTGANLTDADLRGANLSGAILTGASLRGPNLIAPTVTQAQLDQACGTDVKLDLGLTLKPCPK